MTARETRKRLRPSTIRGKLIVGVALLLGGVAAFLLSYLPAQVADEAMRQMSDKVEAVGEITAYSLVPGILFDDAETVEAIIRGARRDRGIRYIVVEDLLGVERGSFRPEEAWRSDYRATDERNPARTQSLLKVMESIRHDDRVIGHVYMGFSLDAVHASVAESRKQLVLVIAVLFLFAFAGILAVGSILTRPLARIVRAAEDISAGDLSRRSGVRSGDELGRFARTFDSMIERLQDTQGELHALNRTLEERVEERTSELHEALRETMKAEREATESEHRFRAIFDSAAIGIALIDPALHITEVNPALEVMFMAAKGELTHRSVTELFDHDDHEGGPGAIEQLRQVLDGNREIGVAEVRCLPLDAGELWVSVVVSPMRNADGEAATAIAMVQDVTAQRNIAEQLRQSQKLDAVGRLAGGIAHDFNNLLTVINSVSDLMLDELGDAERLREDVLDIRDAGSRAASLTRQLLAFSRCQALKPSPLDVNDSIREMSTLLRRLIGENIALDLELSGPLPRVTVDPGQLSQVIMNLAVNARDAMPRGGRILIETSVLELSPERAVRFDAEPGRVVQITVTDTGHGMDAETRMHAFEPFFTTRGQGDGTGLGLATVYGIVKQSAGGVIVHSEPGRGATFQIVLPVTHELPTVHPATDEPSAGGRERMLLVEDEPAVRALMTRILRKRGYVVTDCGSPAEALAVVAENPRRFDGIISDVIMPGMSGPEMAAEIRAIVPEIAILFVSGYPREELTLHGIGDEDFLQKPMTPDELTGAVRSLLDRRAQDIPATPEGLRACV
jgi:PAS domain S-box-containing protein